MCFYSGKKNCKVFHKYEYKFYLYFEVNICINEGSIFVNFALGNLIKNVYINDANLIIK